MPPKSRTSRQAPIRANLSQVLLKAKKLYLAGHTNQAATIYKQVLRIKPLEPQALHMMGLIYFELQNVSLAIQMIRKALSIQPSNANVRYDLATMLKNQGNFASAAEEYRRTIEHEPNFSAAYNNLGVTLMTQGKPTEAVTNYHRAISIQPKYSAAFNNLGNALRALGNLKEAVANYKEALSINPQYTNAYFNLGSTYYDLKDYAKAADNYKNTLLYAPEHQSAKIQLGDALYKMDDFEGAIHVFQTAKTAHSRARILECLYTLEAYDRFYETLEQSIDEYSLNIRAAAISAFASQQLGRDDPHLFCKKPLDYVRLYPTIDGADQPDFLNDSIDYLKQMDAVWEPPGKTTKSGFQTRASLFDQPSGPLLQLEQALKKQITKYVDEFTEEDCGFIQSFPTALNLSGWFVRLIKGGHQTEHIHATGWLSGVFYLQVPKTIDPEEGTIELGLWGYDYPILKNNYPTKRYYPQKGNLILFPSSLFHRTLPMHSDEDRLCIAFDLSPPNETL